MNEDQDAQKLLDARLLSEAQQGLMKATLAVPAAGRDSNVSDIRDFFAKREGKTGPPRTPTPRSPMRQSVPTVKVQTNAVGKLNSDRIDEPLAAAGLGDLLIKMVAENQEATRVFHFGQLLRKQV